MTLASQTGQVDACDFYVVTHCGRALSGSWRSGLLPSFPYFFPFLSYLVPSRVFLPPQVKCADQEEAWAPSTALRGMILSRMLLTSLPFTHWAEFSSLLRKLWTGGPELSPVILKGQWTTLFTALVLIACIWKWGCWVGNAPTFGSYTPAKAKETASLGSLEQQCT